MPVLRHAEHSFDLELIERGQWALDIGCRGFVIPMLLAGAGINVLAVDADPYVSPPDGWCHQVGDLSYYQFAVMPAEIAANRKLTTLHMHPHDQQAHTTVRAQNGPVVQVPTISLQGLLNLISTDDRPVNQFALLKLDCEGAEYGLMHDVAWHAKHGRAIARQVSVEYHDHCGLNPQADMDRWYAQLHGQLAPFYEIVKHERERPPWGGSPHFIDSLYLLRREFWR